MPPAVVRDTAGGAFYLLMTWRGLPGWLSSVWNGSKPQVDQTACRATGRPRKAVRRGRDSCR